MIAPNCKHENAKRNGKDRKGTQRYRCLDCNKTWTERKPQPFGNMRIDRSKALLCVRLLLEGNSIRSIERISGINRNTIMKLLVTVGRNCKALLSALIRDIAVTDVQCDEIWGFVGCKEKTRKRKEYGLEIGDAYCFTSIERNSKLILAWHLGRRDPESTRIFSRKLANATTGIFQVTTDGWRPYEKAIPEALGHTHFAQLIKVYSKSGGRSAEARYSPTAIEQIIKKVRTGKPNEDLICTSHIERSNLTIRMSIRRMTRLTNAFSKKWENHEAALALFFAYYNFCRVHSTIKTTPAVEAGITATPWSVEEMLEWAAAATHS